MPTCKACRGSGQIEKKTEITARCPDCDGTKLLPNGTECKRCNKWGEIGTGQFEVEMVLCTTCWGSGKVSEGSLIIWFLVRAVPVTLLLVGGGLAAAWAAWHFWQSPLAVTGATVLFFGSWAGAMIYLIGQMPDMGEISVTNWFLIRAIPTTLTALAIGGPVVWSIWVYLHNAPVTVILALTVLATWGVLMYYFISHLPE